jgi:hypothetical protein
MEESILTSTKKILGISEAYEAFDLDIITHINSTFSIVNQFGVGPDGGFSITDKTATWSDFDVPDDQLGLLKTYFYLKVRVLFDPPGTSYLIEAMNKQIEEHEHRLCNFREALIPIPTPPPEEVWPVW